MLYPGKVPWFFTAKGILIALGRVGVECAFIEIFRQGSKFLNLLFPGAGSAISGGIASLGMYGIGKAAIAHFLKGVKLENLKDIVKEEIQNRNNIVKSTV